MAKERLEEPAGEAVRRPRPARSRAGGDRWVGERGARRSGIASGQGRSRSTSRLPFSATCRRRRYRAWRRSSRRAGGRRPRSRWATRCRVRSVAVRASLRCRPSRLARLPCRRTLRGEAGCGAPVRAGEAAVLAARDRGQGAARGAWLEAPGAWFQSFPKALPQALLQPAVCRRLTLYRSQLQPQGAQYTPLAQVELSADGRQ